MFSRAVRVRSAEVSCGLLACGLMSVPVCVAQGSGHPIEPHGVARQANAEGTYQALRAALPGGDGYAVKDFTLEREGGSFHFEQGNFYLYGPVTGHVTGAVFMGKGNFALAPTEASEQHSLALLTKNGVMAQSFTTVVLRFTDGTDKEIIKASTGSAGKAPGQVASAGSDFAKAFRKELQENLELRMLPDLLDEGPGHLFLASFRMGGVFSARNVLFEVDPEGTFHAAPDEVELSTWTSDSLDTWAAYRMKVPGTGKYGGRAIVKAEKLDVAFDKSGAMKISAETTLTNHREGLRVVRLNLYPTLRVSGVYLEDGAPLDYIQENKEMDSQFAIVLPKAVKAGEQVRVLTRYEGPDAVKREGDGMYYLKPGARESWYPSGAEGLGQFASFDMTFHLPKGLGIVATGKQVSRDAEGAGTRAVWRTDAPIAVAGFNLGDFKSMDAKTPDGFDVSAYANTELPDYIKPFVERANVGTMSTVPALKDEVTQGTAAIQVYTNYFGKLPYDHVALTQQSACNFGQSWPMLVYLPTCAFWDSTIQQRMGLLEYDRSYWQEVTPHEVSHQWWGQLVGFSSYRDQWMSEGFANFSVGVYLLNTRTKMDDYHEFWNEQKTNLLQKNRQGLRPVDVGPLTMGERVSNEKSGGNVYQLLIYSKGAYILHMLEMMYWTPQEGHNTFKHSIQEFVKEYSGKAATTEDFKHSFERTMPKWVNVRGDGKLDWFFDEYVYGTEVPHYTIASDFKVEDGETMAHFKVTQSGVGKSFVMLVPMYLQMSDGRTVRVANLTLKGEDVVEKTVKLGKLPANATKMVLNYNADVLSD